MAGVQYTVEGEGFAEAAARLRALADGFATAETYDRIGSLVTGQTQQRIATDKAAPDGARWRGWSPAYGATRHAGQSLLQAEGDLRDSIQQVIEGDELRVGSEPRLWRDPSIRRRRGGQARPAGAALSGPVAR
jgi:hypothetical protein